MIITTTTYNTSSTTTITTTYNISSTTTITYNTSSTTTKTQESISMLDAQLKMLDLDTLSELQEQVSQMKVEQETASDNLGEDDMADVHELYTMVKKSQCLVDSVPLLTDRLTSLKGVHEQGHRILESLVNIYANIRNSLLVYLILIVKTFDLIYIFRNDSTIIY